MAMTALLMFVALAGLLMWGIKGSMGIQNMLKNKRAVKILFTVYGLVLVVSVFVFEILPKNEIDLVHAQSEDQLNKEMERLDNAIFNGRTDEIDPKFIVKQWKWEYGDNELQVKDDEFSVGLIVVERKSENDGLIEGTYYARSVMAGIDLTDEYQTHEVKLENATLHLTGAQDEKDFKFVVFEKDFVITQFNGERKNEMEFNGYQDVSYLYLKVPKDLKLNPGNMEDSIHYVGEDE